MSGLLKPIILILIEVVNALAKFFTIHFAKMMTLTGIILAIIFVSIFVGTKK